MKAKKNTQVRWSNEEVRLLKKLFPKGKAREIANQLGRSVGAVRMKAQKIGLSKIKPPVYWSAQEKNLLKKLYANHSVKDIANQLGRPVPLLQEVSLFLLKYRLDCFCKSPEDILPPIKV